MSEWQPPRKRPRLNVGFVVAIATLWADSFLLIGLALSRLAPQLGFTAEIEFGELQLNSAFENDRRVILL
jgi:hypothetical protein